MCFRIKGHAQERVLILQLAKRGGYTLRRNIVRIQYLGAQRRLKPGLRQTGQADGAAGAQRKPGHSAYLAGLCQRGGLGTVPLKNAELVHLFTADHLLGRQRPLQNAQVYPADALGIVADTKGARLKRPLQHRRRSKEGGERVHQRLHPFAGQRAAAKTREKAAKSDEPASRRQPEGGLVAFLKIMDEQIVIRLGDAFDGICGKAVG